MSNDNQTKTDVKYDKLNFTTPKAICVEIDGEEHWLPKSQVTLKEDTNEVNMPEWLAIDKGLV